MLDSLSLEIWRQRLGHRGHKIAEPDEAGTTTFGLWPGPDSIITVAVDLDGTLRPQYRQRYFLCACEPEHVRRAGAQPLRKSDAEWRDDAVAGRLPPRPEWTRGYLVPGINPAAQTYAKPRVDE